MIDVFLRAPSLALVGVKSPRTGGKLNICPFRWWRPNGAASDRSFGHFFLLIPFVLCHYEEGFNLLVSQVYDSTREESPFCLGQLSGVDSNFLTSALLTEAAAAID